MTVTEKIEALRALMASEGLAAYIVPSNDPHASEYMAAHWQEMQWLSGFSGEAGTVVVTMTEAKLFTDSRYYLQAEQQLAGTGIDLMRADDIDCPSINEWIVKALAAQMDDENNMDEVLVGVNPEMWSVNDYAALEDEMADDCLGVKSIDLIRPLWKEGRPSVPQDVFYEYEEKYAGESVASKLTTIREHMAAKKADSMVVSMLDEIAWLLNIRGKDVECTPVVIAYVVLEMDKVTLFVAPEKVDAKTSAYLRREGIELRAYEEVFAYISQLDGTILYDGTKVNEALYEAMRTDSINAQSPIQVVKAHKNAVEIEGERKAMLQDSIALTQFFMWLESDATRQEMAAGKVTEWDLMEKLHSFRLLRENFTDESFGTIAGYKGNGAIVHYAASKENCATVYPEGMLLLDSGAQYLDGTTDITRTVWLGGEIPAQAKRDYTYVLKGHLALSMVRFPRGTRGNQLDALAKQYMWQAGITFGHGTGHGMGHFLGDHEGPQNIRRDNNPTVLEVGHVCSNEPGIYRTGEWGIRTENIFTVIPCPQTAEATTEDEWLTWETLTLCFYDTRLIDMSLMTEQEIRWINDYHKRVYDLTAPLLTADEAAWLAQKCKAL
ncbi:MAG: aminopeptidase P family N-terminal domain-containing protein [Paludibacteraceae bacterium]|nr:aminopeptidase P family N-terminal domain-containing protein [Paludibacteraceae bacterium]